MKPGDKVRSNTTSMTYEVRAVYGEFAWVGRNVEHDGCVIAIDRLEVIPPPMPKVGDRVTWIPSGGVKQGTVAAVFTDNSQVHVVIGTTVGRDDFAFIKWHVLSEQTWHNCHGEINP